MPSLCSTECARRSLRAPGEPSWLSRNFRSEEAGGAAIVAVNHRAGGGSMNAELVLDRMRAQVVARSRRAVLVEQELRHQEERNALRAPRRIGQPRQHEMDDVVGEVVLAVG